VPLPRPPLGLLRAVVRHRLLLAAGATAGAVAASLSALAPPAPPRVAVLVAAGDLTGGQALAEDDLARSDLPPDAVPDGALRAEAQALGRVLAGPARRGEPLTDVRLVGAGLLDGWGEGLVAAPVRVTDAGALAVVRPGDLVDVHAAGGSSDAGVATTGATTVATAVRVLAVPGGGDALDRGGLLLVAARPAVAEALAGAAATAQLSVAVRGG
jgi:Flp pilus assembly protein CpaB